MGKPLILINFKTYPEALGNNGILFARKLAAVRTKRYEVALSPSLLTLPFLSRQLSFPLFAQHADPFLPGAHTGSISLEELKGLGIRGTILNHSEKKVSFSMLKKTVLRCKKLGLIVVLCAATVSETKKLLLLKPDYLAYEPKELIGGNISVTKARPAIITAVVELSQKISPKTKVLCGAGVHSRRDVLRALELGCQGVLISHSIVREKNPQKVLQRLLL